MIRLGAALALIVTMSSSSSAQAPQTEKLDCQQFAQSKLPAYRIARKFTGGDLLPKRILVVYVSVQPNSINQKELLSLGCSLGKRFAAEDDLMIRVFDDHQAARKFNEVGEGNTLQVRNACRAVYGFSRRDGTHSLSWRPDSEQRGGWVNVDLGAPPPRPH